MTKLQHNFHCCGLAELANISDSSGDPKQMLLQSLSDAVRRDYDHYPFAGGGKITNLDFECSHIVFSQAYNRGSKLKAGQGYADKLAAYIKANDLGHVVRSRIATNPNSGNRVTVYLWTVNKRNLTAWYKRNPKDLD